MLVGLPQSWPHLQGRPLAISSMKKDRRRLSFGVELASILCGLSPGSMLGYSLAAHKTTHVKEIPGYGFLCSLGSKVVYLPSL